MDKKYFMLKAINRSPFLDKERNTETKLLRQVGTKNDSFHQKSLLTPTAMEKPSFSLDYQHKRNLSTEKHLHTNEPKPYLPKTT